LSRELSIKSPVLLVGIGGAGIRIAAAASAALNCKCLMISNDRKDLIDDDRNYYTVFVDSRGWINPSIYKLRSYVQPYRDKIFSIIDRFTTIIIVANLAGRAGTAVSPMISKMARQGSKTVIALAVMPFKFEKNRIFTSGTTLRRLRETCHCSIVVDNDAFLDNNPELRKEECFEITNRAMVEVISSISTAEFHQSTNILCTSRTNSDSETSLRDSVAMMYNTISDTDKLQKAILYVLDGDRIPIGELNKLMNNLKGVFEEDGMTEVTMLSSTASSSSTESGTRVHLVASNPQKTKFDRYDPVGEIISAVLDWDEPDSSIDACLAIPNME
jgi:cell division protein FtsZ